MDNLKPRKLSYETQEKFWRLIMVLCDVDPEDFNMHSWKKCMAGHAMRDPWFKSKGLRTYDDPYPHPVCNGESEQDALAEFFEIPNWLADDMFSGYGTCLSLSCVMISLETWLRKCEKLGG